MKRLTVTLSALGALAASWVIAGPDGVAQAQPAKGAPAAYERVREVIDDVKTDVKVHERTGAWYRPRLRSHFIEVGAGLWCKKGTGVLFYELEAR